MERDDLHREVYRTQGKLTSCFGYDAMGRKAWQFASNLPADKLSQVHNTGINTSLLVEHAYNPIHRRYQYDPAGELVRTLDKLRGEIKYEYEANGQLRSRDTGSLVGSEEFRYDAAANRLDFNARQFAKVKDNRIRQWRDQEYRYDPWGNLIEKRSGHSKVQNFSYDCENRLVRAETLVNGKLESTGHYRYDSLGRRVAKQSEINGEVEQKRFLWQGLRMLREETPGQSILYLYEPGSYAPLARVDQVEGEEQKLYYFHTDQIGTPLELTDSDGKIVWQATYRSWGSVEQLAVDEVEQNLRFQGQYFDDETGLHYNTFRYYDPEIGRFATQDPIGLLGGFNLYNYAPSSTGWLDPLGWCVTTNVTRGAAGQPLRATATITKGDLKSGTATNQSSRAWARMMGNPDDDAGHIIGKLLGGSGGKDGVFPQLKGMNRGQFRAFESQVANVVQKKGAVDVELNFIYGGGGTRPTSITYDVYHQGEKILEGIFGN
ncbi:RHS repeat-associated core domain-containing protein [Pseudomonas asiatica]